MVKVSFSGFDNASVSDISINGKSVGTSFPSEGVEAFSTVTLKITPDDGFKIASVKLDDGSEVPYDEESQSFSFTIEATALISVTVVDKDAVVAKEYTETYIISDIATANSWSNDSKQMSLPVETGSALTITAAGSGNNVKYFSQNSDWRFYQSGNGKLIITVKDGYELVSVTIEGKQKYTGIFDKLTDYQGTYLIDSEEEKQSVTFTVENSKNDVTNGQCQVTKITVKYKEAIACNHEWDEGVVTKEATCAETGIKTYTCSKCSLTKTEEIPLSETHSLGTGIDEVPATCTEPGTVAHTDCTVCGKHFDNSGNEIEDADLVIDALGHNFVNGVCDREGCGAKEGETIEVQSVTYTFGTDINSNPTNITKLADITGKVSNGENIITSATLTQCYWKDGTALKFGSKNNAGKLELNLGEHKATKIKISIQNGTASGVTVNGVAQDGDLKTTGFAEYEWTLSDVSEIVIASTSTGTTKFVVYISSITIYYN